MKKILAALIFFLFGSLCGCVVPGAYMTDVSGSLQNRLMQATLIPLDGTPGQEELHKQLSTPYRYKVGPYDALNIVVWGHPEMSSPTSSNAASMSPGLYSAATATASSQPYFFPQFTAQETGIFVDANGDAIFPLVGKMHVASLTVVEVRDRLTAKLAQYIRYPQITIRVVIFNSQRVHVLGEVMQPGMRFLTDRPLTILDAINLSGGTSQSTASAKNIYVIHKENQKIRVYWLNAKSPQGLVMAEQFRLAADDIVYVAPAGIASWNRIISQLLPTIQTVWYTRSLVRN